MNGRIERVKAALRTRDELCAIEEVYAGVAWNARNDISRLQLRDQWQIASWWEDHGRGRHKHYQLITEGRPKTKPQQTQLAIAG